MSWLEILGIVWGVSAVVVLWCHRSSIRAQK
jgi:hypothetical protein